MPARQIAVLTLSLALATACPARADEASCNVGKLKALAHAVTDTLRCRARAAAQGGPVDPGCQPDVDAALTDVFAVAEARGGCAAQDEVGDVIRALHAFDLELGSLLVTGNGQDQCAAGKMSATARRARREVACRRRAAADLQAPAAVCVTRAQTDMAAAFARRDNGGACATTGDVAAVETLVADFLVYAAGRIDGSLPDTLPSDLSAVVNGAAVELDWTAPDPSSGLTEARVLRKLASAPTGPDDAAAALIFDGSGESALDNVTDLLPNTTTVPRTYHYAVYGCDTVGACKLDGSHTTLSLTVSQALVAGGYVLHWRHAAADVCADRTDLGPAATTSVPDWWKSCDANCGTATARQLNSTGRNDAVTIGSALDTRGIVIGRVVASEFCRNMETATLMDFGPAIEQSPETTFFVYDEPARCSNSYAMLGVVPSTGTNTALIGHAGFSPSCPVLSSLAWGEAAIFKPDGMGGTSFIERVLASSWLSLP